MNCDNCNKEMENKDEKGKVITDMVVGVAFKLDIKKLSDKEIAYYKTQYGRRWDQVTSKLGLQFCLECLINSVAWKH